MIENENTEHSSINSFYGVTKKNDDKNTINLEEKRIPNIIKIISDILNDICEQSKINKDEKSKLITIFMTQKRPNITIFEFLKRLYKYSGVKEEILILVLIYIDRLCGNRKICLNYIN